MTGSVLEVRDLVISFHTSEGVVHAVNGVSFSLQAGRTLGIVGESGCGKSVTSLSIMGLLPKATAVVDPKSSILFDGEELTRKKNREMSLIRGDRISMIFQDSMTSLNPVLTIGDQLAEAYVRHQHIGKVEALQRSLEMLRRVGIPSPELRMKNYPHQLSGGMRQRVMIAIALACNPDVLIADEPTTALDVTVQAQILELMRDLKREMNTSIILITHDMGVVAGMADDIMVMYCGYVMEHSDARSLFKAPLHPYTEGLLKSIPRPDHDTEELHVIKGVVPSLSDLPEYCVFAKRCPYAQDRCFEASPDLYRAGERLVRCFRYENAGGGCGNE